MTLIDLSPTVRGGGNPHPRSRLYYEFELACEYLDAIGSRPFSFPELFRASSPSAARQLIKAYLALGFIDRVTESRGRRPVLYRVLSHALPKRVAS
jgi:hypothetical protein